MSIATRRGGGRPPLTMSRLIAAQAGDRPDDGVPMMSSGKVDLRALKELLRDG